MGFGFLEFDSVDTAVKVSRDLQVWYISFYVGRGYLRLLHSGNDVWNISFQGTVLDGHALILQLCHVKNNERVKEKVDKDQSSTKLIVRNVAFEATEKELRQLFSPFGQVNVVYK